MTAPKLTMPTQTLLQGMPYKRSWDTDLRERFRQMAIEIHFGVAPKAVVQPIKGRKG